MQDWDFRVRMFTQMLAWLMQLDKIIYDISLYCCPCFGHTLFRLIQVEKWPNGLVARQ